MQTRVKQVYITYNMSKNIVFTEVLGTFFLTLIIAFTGNPFAVGAVLIALVYSGGPVSGAHYNPAVSLAQFIAKRISSRDLVFYVLSQIVGAVLASLAFFLIVGSPFLLTPNPQATNIQIAFAEGIFTFILAFVVLSVTAKAVKNNQYFGLAIGLIVMAGAFAVGGISGGIFNPAVAISSIALDIKNIQSSLNYLAIFVSAQLVAGIVAGLASKLQNNKS